MFYKQYLRCAKTLFKSLLLQTVYHNTGGMCTAENTGAEKIRICSWNQARHMDGMFDCQASQAAPVQAWVLLRKKYLPSGNILLANKKAFRLQMKSDFFIILIFFHQCCSFFLFHACHCCSFFFNIFLTFNIKRSFSDRSVQVLCRDKSRITEVF